MVCICCGETKAVDQFYKHKYMASGRLNKCIACCRQYCRDLYQRHVGEGRRSRSAPRKVGRAPRKLLPGNKRYGDQRRSRKQVTKRTELDRFVVREADLLALSRTAATGVRWHVDHIIPLNHRRASGLHNAFNVQVVPARWNIQKSNRHSLDFWSGAEAVG